MSDPRELLDAYAAEELAAAYWMAPDREDQAPKAFAALRAVLERHKPGYPDGPSYSYHMERTEAGQYAEVRNANPDPPYFCETCQEQSPCPTVQDIITELEAK